MANGNCRSPFHKLKIIEKRKKIASIYWENNVLLPCLCCYIPEKPCWWSLFHQMGRLTKTCWSTRQWIKCNLCQWVSTAANSCSPEISWSTCLSCSNTGWQKAREAVSRRDLHSNTAKLPVQVGIPCQLVPWQMSWCCWSKQSENKITVFLPGNWAAGRLLQLSQRETLKKLSLFSSLGSCCTVPCLI